MSITSLISTSVKTGFKKQKFMYTQSSKDKNTVTTVTKYSNVFFLNVLLLVTNKDLEEVGTKTASPTRACSRNEISDTKEQTPGTSMLNRRKRRQEEEHGD